MIVFNPSLASQVLSFIPRIDTTGTLFVTIKDSYSSVVINDVFNSYSQIDGIITINDLGIEFPLNGSRYTIKIEDNNNTLFRGQAIASNQEPQEYKDTKDVYIYE